MPKAHLILTGVASILLSWPAIEAPAQSYCTGHENCQTDWEVRKGADIELGVFVQVSGQSEVPLQAGKTAKLDAACVDDSVTLRVEANDKDSAVCETITVQNYIEPTNVTVDVYVEGYKDKATTVTLTDTGTPAFRKWGGSWPIPKSVEIGGEKVPLTGTWLRFEFSGTIDDVDCPAPKHKKSYSEKADLGRFKARLPIPIVDLIAHRSGKYLDQVVTEADEDSGDPNNLIMLVNNDRDENLPDGKKDLDDAHMKVKYGPDERRDDDLIKITLKQPEPSLDSGTLRVTLSDAQSVRVFKDDGTGDVLSDFSVDLALPNGDLSGLAKGDVDVWLEGLQNNSDFVFSYSYSSAGGKEISKDDIHMRIVTCTIRDRSGKEINKAISLPKEDVVDWGLMGDILLPDFDEAFFYMEIDGLTPSEVTGCTVQSQTVEADSYEAEADPQYPIFKWKRNGCLYYTEQGEDMLTPAEKAKIKTNRGVDVLHNEGARIQWTTYKDYLYAYVDATYYAMVPLGGSKKGHASSLWGVCVPSKHGGILTVSCPGGDISKLRKLKGADFQNGTDVGQNNQGLFVFYVEGKNYTVSNTFVQEAHAKRKVQDQSGNWKTQDYEPWNFWYWPKTVQNPDPHLFDDPGPLTRFDDYFQHHADPKQPDCQAFAWEFNPANKHRKILTEEEKKIPQNFFIGHCRDGAMASAIMDEPNPASVPNANPVNFTQEHLEGFCTEFFTSATTDIPGGGNQGFWTYPLVPQVGGDPGTQEAENDSKVHWLHIALMDSLFTKNRPLVVDICGTVEKGPSSWNHACYRFSSNFQQDPNPAGVISERVREILITTTLWFNGDFNPSDGFPAAGGVPVEETAYRLIFAENGEIMRNIPLAGVKQDWQFMRRIDSTPAVNAYALSAIGLLDTPYLHWQAGASGENPHVTFERLQVLGVQRNNW